MNNSTIGFVVLFYIVSVTFAPLLAYSCLRIAKPLSFFLTNFSSKKFLIVLPSLYTATKKVLVREILKSTCREYSHQMPNVTNPKVATMCVPLQ